MLPFPGNVQLRIVGGWRALWLLRRRDREWAPTGSHDVSFLYFMHFSAEDTRTRGGQGLESLAGQKATSNPWSDSHPLSPDVITSWFLAAGDTRQMEQRVQHWCIKQAAFWAMTRRQGPRGFRHPSPPQFLHP